MPYATADDMIAAFGEAPLIDLTCRDGSGVIDTGVLAAALEMAHAIADGTLKPRFAVPISPVPDLLRTLVCDLARYQLYVDDQPLVVVERKRTALSTLSAIAAGTLDLGIASLAPPHGEVLMVSGPPRLFSRSAR